MIFKVVSQMLASRSPFRSVVDVDAELRRFTLEDGHLLPFTKALLDAEIARIAKNAQDAIFSGTTEALDLKVPSFEATKEGARKKLSDALADGTWSSRVKGRDLLRAFCAQHGLKYEHFRNSVISQLGKAPEGLRDIIDKIKAESLGDAD